MTTSDSPTPHVPYPTPVRKLGPPATPAQPTVPQRVFCVYEGTRLVDVATIISVTHSEQRRQVAFQLQDGQYSTWHDVRDAEAIARGVCQAVLAQAGAQAIRLGTAYSGLDVT